MVKKIVAANWKMNLLRGEAISLFNSLNESLNGNSEAQVVVFPPSIFISDLLSLNSSRINIGAQNFYFEDKGAFTGEVSAIQLKDMGCTYVLIGHSERRNLFGESNQMLYQKIKAALRAGLNIVYCCGESLEERESGKHKIKIQAQIEVLKSLSYEDLSCISIAYEPIWAIGTGRTATPDQAEEMHAFVREVLNDLFSASIAQDILILYGGSCNEKNAAELFNCANIDGGLIGGASLKESSFLKIVEAAE